MNEKKANRIAKKEKEQAKQASNVVKGIFIALILLALSYVVYVTTTMA